MLDRGNIHLTAQTVLLVNGGEDLDLDLFTRLLMYAHKARATVIVMADRARTGFLPHTHPYHLMTSVIEPMSWENPWERDNWTITAKKDFAEGRFEQALQSYGDHGHVVFEGSLNGAANRLVDEWLRTADLKYQFVMAFDLEQANALNKALRARYIEVENLTTQIHQVQTHRGSWSIAPGERIQFTKAYPQKGIEKFSLATVVAIKDSSITVVLDDGCRRTIDLMKFAWVRPGYASHRYHGQNRTPLSISVLYDADALEHCRDEAIEKGTGHLSPEVQTLMSLVQQRGEIAFYGTREQTPDAAALGLHMAQQILPPKLIHGGLARQKRRRRSQEVEKEYFEEEGMRIDTVGKLKM